MKWPKRDARRKVISTRLDQFSRAVMPLPGVIGPKERDALSMQIVASERREEYFKLIQQRGEVRSERADPANVLFKPELAVVHFIQQGNIEEASWLIFLMVYMAKPPEGWDRLKDIYGKLGTGRWNWAAVCGNPSAFEHWLAANWSNVGGKFGNHRKYESLDPSKARPMGPAVVHYVNWINAGGGHKRHFATLVRNAGNNPHTILTCSSMRYQSKALGGLDALTGLQC